MHGMTHTHTQEEEQLHRSRETQIHEQKCIHNDMEIDVDTNTLMREQIQRIKQTPREKHM